ncbi:hypothetical protein KIPB_001339 [Kipferlia bialata]|uniref:Uncharacterized protein n=1 Tax=Kipferlia bialata TaxID=797122 RepID=A0A9K3CQG9_9EUKA|nr:hypothetical protein KIPB_001339 [Kipferlia bialata]|eukprot:g1339.t1
MYIKTVGHRISDKLGNVNKEWHNTRILVTTPNQLSRSLTSGAVSLGGLANGVVYVDVTSRDKATHSMLAQAGRTDLSVKKIWEGVKAVEHKPEIVARLGLEHWVTEKGARFCLF